MNRTEWLVSLNRRYFLHKLFVFLIMQRSLEDLFEDNNLRTDSALNTEVAYMKIVPIIKISSEFFLRNLLRNRIVSLTEIIRLFKNSLPYTTAFVPFMNWPKMRRGKKQGKIWKYTLRQRRRQSFGIIMQRIRASNHDMNSHEFDS